MRVAWVVDEDLNYAMLAFEEEATGATLDVQRALQMDEQDRQLAEPMRRLSVVSGTAAISSLRASRVCPGFGHGAVAQSVRAADS